MKVYATDGGALRLVGRADVPEGVGAVYEVPLFGPASVILERFAVCELARLPADGGTAVVERAVVLSHDQGGDILPGWAPLAS